MFLGFPWESAGKESACNAGDLSSIPELGRSPGEGKGSPLQYSGLENSMEFIVHGVTKSQTRLSDFHFLWASLVVETVKNLPAMQETWVQPLGQEDLLKKGINGYPLQYSYLENPVHRGAWWATVHGVVESDPTKLRVIHTITHQSLLEHFPKSDWPASASTLAVMGKSLAWKALSLFHCWMVCVAEQVFLILSLILGPWNPTHWP